MIKESNITETKEGLVEKSSKRKIVSPLDLTTRIHWIKITDELPPLYTPILLMTVGSKKTKSFSIGTAVSIEDTDFRSGGVDVDIVFTNFHFDGHRTVLHGVTHWAPTFVCE